jgi:phospholipid/cholesterol/gamma-HCH transport system ATP-binding protein
MPEDASQSVLRFESVSVVFDETPVLSDVSFEMLAGETCVVLGAAGSGKTVLLKAALGLARATAGRIYVFGQDVTTLGERDWVDLRSRMGMVFQEGGLFDSLTIEENVSYPLLNQPQSRCSLEDVRSRVEEALRFVELEHTMDKFPSELSGGMRRRVGIARAVVTEPPLVLYDSPTAGLDPITAYTIMALIIKERDLKDAASVIVTHRYQDGQLAAKYRYNPDSGGLEVAAPRDHSNGQGTKFLVLREGRLVFEGTQEELEASRDGYVSKFANRSDD